MNKHEFEKLFDAYIDGLLEGELLDRFEAFIEQRPELKARVEAHRAIDDSIRRSFTPSPEFAQRNDASVAGRVGKRRVSSRRRLLAACIGLIVIGATALVYTNALAPGFLWGTAPQSPYVKTEPKALYRQLEKTSFKPEWACADDEEFFEYTLDKFNMPFLVHRSPAFTLTGWTSSFVFSRYTGVLMAKGAGGDDIVVILDQPRFDREFNEPNDDSLRLFRREVAGLVFYEITPAEAPIVIPQVYQPEIPIDPEPE